IVSPGESRACASAACVLPFGVGGQTESEPFAKGMRLCPVDGDDGLVFAVELQVRLNRELRRDVIRIELLELSIRHFELAEVEGTRNRDLVWRALRRGIDVVTSRCTANERARGDKHHHDSRCLVSDALGE